MCLELALSSKQFDLETLEKIITSLLDLNLMLGEGDNDDLEKQLITFYVKSITQCVNSISKKNIIQGLGYTSDVISILGEYLADGGNVTGGEVQSVIFNSLNSLLSFALSSIHLDYITKTYFSQNNQTNDEDLINDLSLTTTENKTTNTLSLFEKICSSVLYLLGDRFENSLKLSFSIIFTFMDKIHKYEYLHYLNENILTVISENANIKKTQHFKSFIGRCFNILDTKLIFNFFPIQCLDYDIQSEDYTENSMIWILSYMDKYLKEEKTLKEFLLSFIGIIEDLEKMIERLEKNEKLVKKLSKFEDKKATKNDMDLDMEMDQNKDNENQDFMDDDNMEEDDLNENFLINKTENKYVLHMKIKRYELIIQQIWRLSPYFCSINQPTTQNNDMNENNENDDFSTYVHYFLEKIDTTLTKYPATRIFIFRSLCKIITNSKLKADVKAIKVIKKEGKKFFIRTINWLLAVGLSNEEMKEGFLLFSNFAKVLTEKDLYSAL